MRGRRKSNQYYIADPDIQSDGIIWKYQLFNIALSNSFCKDLSSLFASKEFLVKMYKLLKKIKS